MHPESSMMSSSLLSPRPLSLPRLPSRQVAATLLSGIALALAGCATPMLKSTVDVPDHFSAMSADEVASQSEVAWWTSYDDPILTGLIERAAVANRDVRIAAERVRAARAGETISRSWLLPSIGASAGATRSSNGYEGAARLG